MKVKKKNNAWLCKYLKYVSLLLVVFAAIICAILSLRISNRTKKAVSPNSSTHDPNLKHGSPSNSEFVIGLDRNKALLKLLNRLPSTEINSEDLELPVCRSILAKFANYKVAPLEHEESFEEDLIVNLSKYVEIAIKYSAVHTHCLDKTLYILDNDDIKLPLSHLKGSIKRILGTNTLGIFIKYTIFINDTYKLFNKKRETRNMLFYRYKRLFEFYNKQMKIVVSDFISKSYEIITFYNSNSDNKEPIGKQIKIENILNQDGLLFRLFANANIFKIIDFVFDIEHVRDVKNDTSDIEIKIKEFYRNINKSVDIIRKEIAVKNDLIKYINTLTKYMRVIDNKKKFKYENDKFLTEIDKLNVSIMLNINHLFPKVELQMDGTREV
eukprot:GAHX01002091.1.p1 GENE.GAHX01002091.1~~GAHX01002091.1.p1  ORF type:complete len:383 (-),score=61.69 GAHX01002091.1:61-1209(-)